MQGKEPVYDPPSSFVPVGCGRTMKVVPVHDGYGWIPINRPPLVSESGLLEDKGVCARTHKGNGRAGCSGPAGIAWGLPSLLPSAPLSALKSWGSVPCSVGRTELVTFWASSTPVFLRDSHPTDIHTYTCTERLALVPRYWSGTILSFRLSLPRWRCFPIGWLVVQWLLNAAANLNK